MAPIVYHYTGSLHNGARARGARGGEGARGSPSPNTKGQIVRTVLQIKVAFLAFPRGDIRLMRQWWCWKEGLVLL